LRDAVPCSMVLWVLVGTKVGSTAHAHARIQFAQMCAHVHTAHALPACTCCAAQRSRALRAGKYAWGAAGKNACPDGTARIDDLPECQAAAAAAARPPPSSENSDDFPKGCYSSTLSTGVSFNAHATGARKQVDADIVMLCAGTGVPASPAPPRRRHPRTCTCGCRHSLGASSTVLTGPDPCAHHGVSTRSAQVPHGPRMVGAATPSTSPPKAAPTSLTPTSFPTTAATPGATGCALLASTALRTHAPPVCRCSCGECAATSPRCGHPEYRKYFRLSQVRDHSRLESTRVLTICKASTREGCWALS
jgi:hypothetical protein